MARRLRVQSWAQLSTSGVSLVHSHPISLRSLHAAASAACTRFSVPVGSDSSTSDVYVGMQPA
jgi:hypothetical protein